LKALSPNTVVSCEDFQERGQPCPRVSSLRQLRADKAVGAPRPRCASPWM